MQEPTITSTEEPVRVVLDERGRVGTVRIVSLDADLRRSARLAEAFDAAFAAAVGESRAESSSDSAQAEGGPERRARPHQPFRRFPALDHDPGRSPRLDLLSRPLSDPSAGAVDAVGESSNSCVRVRLAPASSRGSIRDVDQGWLAGAAPDRVAQAITEAFEGAYTMRDGR